VELVKVYYVFRSIDNILDWFVFILGRASINRTPDALSSMDCNDDSLFPNQPGTFSNKWKEKKTRSQRITGVPRRVTWSGYVLD